MFSLNEWNFEEYKAALKEIEDPVDRLDELTATYGKTFFERDESDNYLMSGQEPFEENELIKKRFNKFESWAKSEIERHQQKYKKEIELRKKSAWKDHVRLPYPLVWNRESYHKIEPEVRKTEEKKTWIEWLLKNLVELRGDYWTFEQWLLNAVENENYYERFAESVDELMYPSIIVRTIEYDFVVFLFNVQKVLSLKDEKKRKRAIDREPIEIERNELEKIILRTMKARKLRGENFNWYQVMRELRNHTEKDQRIVISEIPAPDDSMKEGISLYIDGFTSPIQTLLVSTFKKKLSQLRKITVTQVT